MRGAENATFAEVEINRTAVPEILADDFVELEVVNGNLRGILVTHRDTHTNAPWVEPLIRVAIPVSMARVCAERVLAKTAVEAIAAVYERVRGMWH